MFNKTQGPMTTIRWLPLIRLTYSTLSGAFNLLKFKVFVMVPGCLRRGNTVRLDGSGPREQQRSKLFVLKLNSTRSLIAGSYMCRIYKKDRAILLNV